jgi:site-specific DNA recombinase
MNNQVPLKYFLYIRKSTDEEDRQVLSLEAQLTELKKFAEREHLEIIETFIEKKTAKVPGREVFNIMLDKIEGGLPHQFGILAWHTDRLSRNSVDGGRLIYLLDTGKLADLKFPTSVFDNSPSGKFFLSIALSNAKYYIANLSENVRRGNRAKLRQGGWPGQKPFGYIYDHRLRNIVPEPREAKIVKKVFAEHATGKYNLRTIADYLAKLTKAKVKSNYGIESFLRNELYMGVMKWNGETYEGKFQPLITKRLFEKVREVLRERSRPRKTKSKHDFPFVGLFHCSCGSMITAQWTHGNGGTYRYYRCTRKHGACSEKYVQENDLKRKIIEKSQAIALPADWTRELYAMLDIEEKKETKSAMVSAEAISKKIFLIDEKLDKLVSGYLDNLIDEDTYRKKKEEFVEQKISLKNEKESLLRRQISGWIEPARDYINTLCQAEKIASVESLGEISQFVQKIGTNRLISEKSPFWNWKPEYEFAEATLRRFAFRKNGSSTFSFSKTNRSPVLCAIEDSNL